MQECKLRVVNYGEKAIETKASRRSKPIQNHFLPAVGELNLPHQFPQRKILLPEKRRGILELRG